MKISVRAQKSRAACGPPRNRTETIPPNPLICRAATSWFGCDGSPG